MSNAIIEVTQADKSVGTITLENGQHLVGRDSGAVILKDTVISGRHAQFTVDDNGVVFEDLNSTNGSYFDGGLKIEKAYLLKVGNVIKMGNSQVKLINFQQSATAAPVAQESLANQKTMMMSAPSEGVPPASPQSNDNAPPASAEPEESAPHGQSASPSTHSPDEPNAPLATRPTSTDSDTDLPSCPPPFAQQSASGFQKYVDDLMGLWKYTIAVLQPRIMEIAVPILLFTLAMDLVLTVATQLVMLIPAVGFLLSIVIAILAVLVSIPLTFVTIMFLYPIIARWILGLYLGTPISLKQAWQQHKQALGRNMVNTFVTTFIGGITLGLLGTFIFQIPFVEGRFNLDANLRSWEILKHSIKRVLFVMIGTFVPVHVAMLIASAILMWIPFLGPIGISIITGVVYGAMIPIGLLLITCIYFDTREELENQDPRDAARESLGQY